MKNKELLEKIAFFGKNKKAMTAYNEYANTMNEPKNLDLLNSHLEKHSKSMFKKNLKDLSGEEWNTAFQKAKDTSGLNKKKKEIFKNYNVPETHPFFQL